MNKTFWVYVLSLSLILSCTLVYAADSKVVVIPLVEECCTCKGTLFGTRWCDNGDGTVTDLLGYNGEGKCLVWLKDAYWGSHWPFWSSSITGTNAHDRAAEFEDGVGGLSDGSQKGDWRLPTRNELYGLGRQPEPVNVSNMRAFTRIQGSYYWTSTAYDVGSEFAWVVDFGCCWTISGTRPKYDSSVFVWPVRAGR